MFLSFLQELLDLIEGSTVGEIASDSSNIVDLIKANYEVRTALHAL